MSSTDYTLQKIEGKIDSVDALIERKTDSVKTALKIEIELLGAKLFIGFLVIVFMNILVLITLGK